MQPLEAIPLWLFFLIVITLAGLSLDYGFRLGERRRASGHPEPESPLGSMVAASLGLLAFLLAFTFNIAVARFDDRRVSVVSDANAIGTAYLRADFLDKPVRDHVKKLLREYVAVRVDGMAKVICAMPLLNRSQYKISCG